ncbi:DNA helicase II [Ectothiorhodospiraceae bacterium BW-2]|nr:DNA helicase II [Ectothiorhodospiraceae bacterium BW-2]
MDISDLIEPLNSAQREAVCSESRALLVLAGAGSGKTRVLTHRIGWLIRTAEASAHSILAVTFTNKAAREMRQRLEGLLEMPTSSLWIGTFHGIAHRLLRAHWQEAKLSREFQILDSDDQLRLIKRTLRELTIDEAQTPPKQMQWFINSQKDEGRYPESIEAGGDPFLQQGVEIYRHYQRLCEQQQVVDFAELLLRADELWRQNPETLAHYQRRFTHLLVDEFQDTNTIQYRWLQRLAGESLGIFAVGDDDQSIYGWRGAKIENIHRFQHEFAPCELVRLEQNYRSSGHILAAANHLIAHNSERLGKNLWTADSEGEPLQLYSAFNEQEEARYITERIEQWLQQGIARDEIAILYRSNAQSRVLEEALLMAAIPYRIYGGMRFFERAEIKDALAYLRLGSNPHDDSAFERVVNQPPRGIGAKTIEQLRARARSEQISLWRATERLLAQESLPARAANALRSFMALIQALPRQELPFDHLGQRVRAVVEQSGLIDYFSREKGERGRSRLENLDELAVAAQQFLPEEAGDEFTPLQQFLAHAALEAGEGQADEWQSSVQLMTLHSAKGLEFPCVVLAGMEEGLFPHQMALKELGRVEEERRLCYVGMTRARQQLLLTWAEQRRLFGELRLNRLSRFVYEIPAERLQEIRLRGEVSRPRLFSQAGEEEAWQMGERLRHAKFGVGVVVQAEGSGAKLRLQVAFESGEVKWLMASMARLERLDDFA